MRQKTCTYVRDYKSKLTYGKIYKLSAPKKGAKSIIILRKNDIFGNETIVYPVNKYKPDTNKIIYKTTEELKDDEILSELGYTLKKDIPEYIKKRVRDIVDMIVRNYNIPITIAYKQGMEGVPAYEIFGKIKTAINDRFIGTDYSVVDPEDEYYMRKEYDIFREFEEDIRRYARSYLIGKYTRR